ncbi:hypothetical protein PR202_gb17158 [Eleusine coracana subsp. coracana]|uniref:Sugar phosphate transporter domain-containing protein n=1 Tax=Eleusine coracana subsp. coracana TaxID=191504 RepID=A0AAV5F2B4_ELECO|nr:hypothetical protein PR202_gb17158 [Eleusine coracana subsp. coracana]
MGVWESILRGGGRRFLKRKDSDAGEAGRALEELRGSLYNDFHTSEGAKRQQQRSCGPMIALTFNFMAAVGIIMANKMVMGTVGFNFPIALSLIHYLVAWALIAVLKALYLLPIAPSKSTPFSSLFALGVVMSFSTGLANVIALVIVSFGVAVATVTDLEFNFFGACVALAWIIPSAVNKILWSNLQQSGNWTALAWDFWNTSAITVSALFGFLLQWSGALALGATSAVSHVVLGQFKTIVIMLVAYLVFNSDPGYTSLCGAVIALGGMSVYTYLGIKESGTGGKKNHSKSARQNSPLLKPKWRCNRRIPCTVLDQYRGGLDHQLNDRLDHQAIVLQVEAGQLGRALEELRGSLYNDFHTSEGAKRQQQRSCGPMIALTFNFMAAVGIIMANKMVMGTVGFNFPIALSLIHYLVAWALIAVLKALYLLPIAPSKSTPFSSLFALGVVMSFSTGLANVSLKHNRWDFWNTSAITVSALFGFLLQWSGALALGATSAVSHVVLGQFKTIVIMLVAYLVFNSDPGYTSLCGAVIALGGMSVYTYLGIKESGTGGKKNHSKSARQNSPLLKPKVTKDGEKQEARTVDSV